MGESLKDVTKAEPTLSMPPRGLMDAISINWSGFGFSPGPLTLLSSYSSDQATFSQLLAGAMTSPVMVKPGVASMADSGKEVKEESILNDGKTGESGYKRSRPMNLVVGQPPGLLELQSTSPLFMFTPGLSPSGFLNSPGLLSPLQSPFGMSHQQALAHVTAQAAFSQSYKQMQEELQLKPFTTATDANTLLELPADSEIDSTEISQSNRKSASIGGIRPASDGYNWRKYGQKHVKSRECPRSYYKCTHLDCPVKKKVERSVDGQISEITYKGQHNHELPQLNKRGTGGSAMNERAKPASDLLSQIEEKRLGEAVTSHSKPLSLQSSSQKCEPKLSTTDGAAMITTNEDDDESVAKRRSIENRATMPSSSQHFVSESKIVVQTRSEVDLLDDGFKWRKYGQKIVKGNPHPRSYYRCTYSGCNVRKHVERSRTDSRCVVTTYEGKHNHDIPVRRYNKPTSANSNMLQKTQKPEVQNSGLNKEQIPITLQFKEEQIAAA